MCVRQRSRYAQKREKKLGKKLHIRVYVCTYVRVAVISGGSARRRRGRAFRRGSERKPVCVGVDVYVVLCFLYFSYGSMEEAGFSRAFFLGVEYILRKDFSIIYRVLLIEQ